MRPSKTQVIGASLLFVYAGVCGIIKLLTDSVIAELSTILFWLATLAFITFSAIDWYLGRAQAKLRVRRALPAGLSVGTDNPLQLHIANTSSKKQRVRFTEKLPNSVTLTGLPFAAELQPGETLEIRYSVRPSKRGIVNFGGIDIQVESGLKFWLKRDSFLTEKDMRVFPNFTAISHFELLTRGHVIGQMGIHLNQRRGEGLDFHQLREFRPGDSLRQVDWKATSRALKPISREFQDERDQDIVFMLDNGRRMRAKDEGLSHFDHCLNAFLLTAYVALKQGDAVGFQTFGNTERWVAPIKGRNNLNTLLHQVYDLHSSTATTDYLQAAQQLLDTHRKRSLVVMISNVGDQDINDLIKAYDLLKKNHLVMIACLQERSINKVIDKKVKHFNDALTYTSAVEYQLQRDETVKRLLSSGAIVLDVPPTQLHIALVNEYFSLKRSGRI